MPRLPRKVQVHVPSATPATQSEGPCQKVPLEDTRESNRQVNSSPDVVAHDDDGETVRAYSDDGHSYAGTIVRGVLRGGSE